MKITMKRLASLAMTGALALSISAPAFAAAPTMATVAKGNTTKITSTYQATDIEVLVPGDTAAVIDPYGIGFSVDKSDSSKAQFTGQIVTAPMAIYNKSALDLDVSASAIATVKEGSTMKLATATTKAQGTEGTEGYVPASTSKSAFVQLQVATTTVTSSADADESDDGIKDGIIGACANDATWTGATPITVGTKATAPVKVVTLVKPSLDVGDGTFKKFNAGSIAVFRLTGDCVEDPKDAWATTDGFEANVTFTFKPAATVAP